MLRMTDVAGPDEAHELLLAQVDRALTGRLEDPAVVAAVVGIERLVVATGSTDAAVLRAALAGEPVAGTDPGVVAALVAEGAAHVAAGLIRRASGQPADAAVVNPASGGYDITTDATLLRAAVRAAQGSIDAMPYYGARYGERGSRFATTDSAWLISLAGLGETRAIRQVEWLSRVLAARGMPSWLLEIHLDALVAEVRAVAGDEPVGALPAAASALAQARRRHVDDDLMQAAEGWAGDALGEALPLPRTGALVAAAVADQLAGITRDDSALMDWFTDPERVTADLANALRQVRRRVLEQAR